MMPYFSTKQPTIFLLQLFQIQAAPHTYAELFLEEMVLTAFKVILSLLHFEIILPPFPLSPGSTKVTAN